MTQPVTRRAAVLGSPVSHSLSPALHHAAYAALGLDDWAYERHEVDEGGLAPFVASLDPSWAGLSLTMPLKVAAFDVATEVSPLARATAAINTLVRDDTGWSGDNTDVHGVVAALREGGAAGARRARVLGAGATARSALVALQELGVQEVMVAARDEMKAQQLVDSMDLSIDVTIYDLAVWVYDWPPADVVVSTLPGGPANEAAASVVTGAGRGHMRRGRVSEIADGVLLDVVYADWPTPLARAAARGGATVVPGTRMLLHQAARQVELMTGRSVDDDVLAAMSAALPPLPPT